MVWQRFTEKYHKSAIFIKILGFSSFLKLLRASLCKNVQVRVVIFKRVRMGFYCDQKSPCGCSNIYPRKLGSFDPINRFWRLKTCLKVEKIAIFAKIQFCSIFSSYVHQIKKCSIRHICTLGGPITPTYEMDLFFMP